MKAMKLMSNDFTNSFLALLSDSVFGQSKFFNTSSSEIRSSRIRRISQHSKWYELTIRLLFLARFTLLFLETPPITCIFTYIMFFITFETWIIYFKRFISGFKSHLEKEEKINKSLLETIEKKIGIYISVANLITFFFSVNLLYCESTSVNKGFFIFLPINFLHLTESIMLQPEIHSIFFSTIYILFFFPIIIFKSSFSLTNLFFLMGASASVYVHYVISFFTKKVYEKIIKSKQIQNYSKKEILHCLEDPIALYNNKPEICFCNKEFEKLNQDLILKSNSDIIEVMVDENGQSLKQHIELLLKDKINIKENSSKIFTKKNIENEVSLSSYMITFIKKYFKSLNSIGVAIVIKELGYEIELKILNKINEFTKMILYSMSHEIRTPINGMICMFNLIKKKVDKNLLPLIKIGLACSYFFTSQINSIMDFAQIIKGEFEIHGSYFNVRKFLNKIYKIAKQYLDEKSKKITVIMDVDSQLSTEIYGDQERIRQMLMNLLFNSIKYTEEGTIVLLVKNIDKDWIQFSVIDTGSGFSVDQINLLNNYQPNQYEVINNGLKTFPGFKLSISQMILSKYDSKLVAHFKESNGSHLSFDVPQFYAKFKTTTKKFESRSLYNELTIYPASTNYDKYKLPLQHKTLTFVNQKMSTQINMIKNVNEKIALIVDDIDMNRFVIDRLIKSVKQDIGCIEAKNGLEALLMTQKLSFEEKNIIIFMDIEMPIMNGIESSLEIRKFSKAPIIAITAYTSEEIRKKAFEAGVNMVLNKPVSIHQIKEILLMFGF